jgi:hypothetical protein
VTNSRRFLDHLVGKGQQPIWDVEPERLGALEVDDERVFVQVAGFRPLKDAIDVTCRLPILVERVDGDAVAHQTADPGKLRVPG